MHRSELALREENAKRKQHRIIQVREQSKEIAARLRKRINEERDRQKEHIEKIKIDELRRWRESRPGLAACVTTTDAKEEAHREIQENLLYKQRKEEHDLIAAQRGRVALRKEMDMNRPQIKTKKPKCRSTEVQTEDHAFSVDPTRKEDFNLPTPSLAPESSKCDGVISDRSVDILEKSKKFVEDANKRLDELSKKVAEYQDMHNNMEVTSDRGPVQNAVPFTVTKGSPMKPVRFNNATKLRCDLNKKPVPAQQKIKNHPKKVIPSAKEVKVEKGSPVKNAVVCYDHPNRFTGTYDIPKNIVVKCKLSGGAAEEEEDAVTNAFNETLTNIEEDNCKLKRAQELKQKEAIRELEAIEKSQVRRDYEMLAKTLDEVRKARNSSPSGGNHQRSFNSSQVEIVSSQNKAQLASAFNEILHLPVRISCPKVNSKGQTKLNVGEPADQDQFTGSDSAKSIVLDQLTSDEGSSNKVSQISRKPEVIVENKASNVKVRAVSEGGSRNEPMKIIIQVENLVRNLSEGQQMVPTISKLKSALYGAVNESDSTNYMSPPSEVGVQLDRFLKPQPKKLEAANKIKAPVKGKVPGANLKTYIQKLLEMPQKDVDKLTDRDVSDIATPSSSIINIPTNVDEPVYEEQLTNASRLIEQNLSVLQEVEQMIEQHNNSRSDKNSTIKATNSTSGDTDTLMQRYAAMSHTYNERIHSLDKMIQVIRAEKQSLMYENGVSNVTTVSERDTSTKYKDFGQLARTLTPSGSELSTDSGEILSGSHQIKATLNGPKPGMKTNLGTANKGMGQSRDSGISMSRPVTAADIRDNPREEQFEPMLKDIPRKKPLESPGPILVDLEKKRPPNSISRYSPEAIQAAGHDLSTIIEVDTPHVVGPQETSMPREIRKFPTIEEFALENPTNETLISEVDTVEPVRPFMSFRNFVKTNVEGGPELLEEMELNLSEIASELKKRSLLDSRRNGDKSSMDEEDVGEETKNYIRTLSNELEQMIQRINTQGPKEPNCTIVSSSSVRTEDCDDRNETTIGQMLDNIQPKRFPTREEFNLQNNTTHYKSTEVLKSFLDETTHSDKSKRERTLRSPQKKKSDMNSTLVDTSQKQGNQDHSSDSRSQKRPSESSQSKTLNMSDDLMNALENNLGEMGLRWAVNMLKRSHQQLVGSSSSSECSKEAIPFESKTMSLLTDLEKSSISDESKTSNIKQILLRELIKNRSSNSSNGSTSSGMRSEDPLCIRTSTPVHSNIYNTISTSTLVDVAERTENNSDCLFSGESKLSSVKDDVATLSNFRLNIPHMRLDTGKYGKANDSTLSTEYSLNEHNKRKMTKRVDK